MFRSVEQAPASSSAATDATEPSLFIMAMSNWTPSEGELNLTGYRPELRRTESFDAEVEITSRGDVRIETAVVGPGVEVAANQRDLETTRILVEAQAAEDRLVEGIAHRQLSELHVRRIFDEIVARLKTVV